MSWLWNGGEKRNFNVLIYEEDYKELCLWVLKKPNIETGGDLFGLWAGKHTAVIQMVLGPGKSCTRTTASFYQDIDYLRRVGSYLTENEGVCHIGEWHSHHQLGLARPSGGDENTVWNNMPTYNLKRFVIFIANIQSSKQSYNVNVGCFLFEIDDQGKHMDVLPGKFTILQKNSPLSRKMEVSEERKKGAEKDDESKIAIKELKMEVKEGEKRPSVTYLKPKPTATASERKRVSRGQNNSQPANQNKPDNEESSVDNKKRKMNTEESSPDKTSGHGKTVLEGSLPCEDLKNLAINNEPKEEETSEEAMEQGKEKEQPEKNSPEELKHESAEQHDDERGKSVGKKENDEAGSPQPDQGKTENERKPRPLPALDEKKPEAQLTQKEKYEGKDEDKVKTNDEQPEEKQKEEAMKEQEEREQQEKKNQEVRRDEQRDKGKGKIEGSKGEILEKDKEAGSSQVEKEKVEKNSNPRPLPPKPGKEATPGSKTPKKKGQDKGTTPTRAAQSGAKNAASSQPRSTKGPKKQK